MVGVNLRSPWIIEPRPPAVTNHSPIANPHLTEPLPNVAKRHSLSSAPMFCLVHGRGRKFSVDSE
jgi:hypothetical protein